MNTCIINLNVSELVETGVNQTIYMLVKTQSLAQRNAQITEGRFNSRR